jgi:Arc/MetJ-type ribon-helix-helix transcriptional regulator
MTIHLPPEVEKSLIAKVHSGMFPSLDAAMTQAAQLLLEKIEQAPSAKPKGKAKPAKAAKTVQPQKKPLTRAEFDQHLLALGLISQLPDTDADFDDPDDEPIEIKGEPLSETVIRERR